MQLRILIQAAGSMLIGALLVALAMSHFALQELKVKGPVYNQVVLAKDLVADILPPPLYIVAAYASTLRLLAEPEKLAAVRPELDNLEKVFNERLRFWEAQDFDTSVKRELTKSAIDPANKFWILLKNEFLPAVAMKDMKLARLAHNQMSEAFSKHHDLIELVTKSAETMTTTIEATAAGAERRWTVAATVAAVIMIAVAVGCVVGAVFHVLRPLDGLRKSMLELAGGQSEQAINGISRCDEIGAMAQTVELFRLAAIERQRLEDEQASSKAREHARQQSLVQQVAAFRSEIEGILQILGAQVKSMQAVATNLQDVSQATTGEARAAEEATGTAADNAQAVAAATEELGASIREIASQSHKTSDIVAQTTEAARRANTDVESLAEAAQKIGSIVEMIKNVADQTNLLALNATIEAARAGEAGKGFAVVASEVKGLAAQTARATGEISSQIASVQTSTGMAVDAIRSIASRIDEINGLTGGIAAAVEEQEAATREIAQNVTAAADRSRGAATNVSEVLASADKTRGEAAAMIKTTDEMLSISGRISAAFEMFVAAVSNDIEERRRATRHPYEGKVVIEHGGRKMETGAQDISRFGIRIDPIAGLKPGADVKVDFGQGNVPSTVVWISDRGVGLGFKRALAAIPSQNTLSPLAA